MTRAELLKRFPHAKEGFLRANATDDGATIKHETDHRSPISHPKLERHEATALVGAIPREAAGIQRTTVRFIGYRVRPLDPDNFAGSIKDLLDGLRHAGLIFGDEPWRIKLETEQVKVSSKKDERTEIEIDLP